jgi:hypothetical protein
MHTLSIGRVLDIRWSFFRLSVHRKLRTSHGRPISLILRVIDCDISCGCPSGTDLAWTIKLLYPIMSSFGMFLSDPISFVRIGCPTRTINMYIHLDNTRTKFELRCAFVEVKFIFGFLVFIVLYIIWCVLYFVFVLSCAWKFVSTWLFKSQMPCLTFQNRQ